jgi:hypothetical protein
VPTEASPASSSVDPAVRQRLEALICSAKKEAGDSRDDAKWSRFANYSLIVVLVVGGLVATASGAIASQNADASWPGYAAGIAGAVVTAATAATAKLKPVEKLRRAMSDIAEFEDVKMRAENGLAEGARFDLVKELTEKLTEIRRREPVD